jgi:hypothetical protein
MISPMLITTSVFLLIAFVAFVRALARTAQGYEDAFGFHEGTDPQREMAFASFAYVTTEGPSQQRHPIGNRTKRILERAAIDPMDPMHQSVATSYPY